MAAIREGLQRSLNESAFILEALRLGTRPDGRGLTDVRRLAFTFSRAELQATAEVQLGHTRVLAVVAAEVVPPWPDRPAEGLLHFSVEIGPMATPDFMGERATTGVEVGRIIERGVRDSQALDLEALCLVAGERVWQIRCDIHVLDHGGNLPDAAALAAMAALQHFRRPEVTVGDGGAVVVHHTDEREPSSLPLHHVPLCVTFALFEDVHASRLNGKDNGKGSSSSGGGALVAGAGVARHYAMDPTDAEEDVMTGRITFAINAQGELCTLHKNGGAALPPEALLRCAHLAADKVKALHAVLAAQLAAADKLAMEERLQRLRGTAARAHGAAASTPFVSESAPLAIDAAAAAAAGAAAAAAAAAEPLKHLEFGTLHEAARVREEADPVHTARTAASRGMAPKAAARTELFAAMSRAADRQGGGKAREKAATNAASSGALGAGSVMADAASAAESSSKPVDTVRTPGVRPRKADKAAAAMAASGDMDGVDEDAELDALLAGGAPGLAAAAPTEAASRAAAAAGGGGSSGSGSRNGQSSKAAAAARPAASAAVKPAAPPAAAAPTAAPAAIFVNSDDEGEVVVLRSEFSALNAGGKGGEIANGPAAAKAATAAAAAGAGEDDLLSAVKRKPKGGKGRKKQSDINS